MSFELTVVEPRRYDDADERGQAGHPGNLDDLPEATPQRKKSVYDWINEHRAEIRAEREREGQR